jgi:hypothetical protein
MLSLRCVVFLQGHFRQERQPCPPPDWEFHRPLQREPRRESSRRCGSGFARLKEKRSDEDSFVVFGGCYDGQRGHSAGARMRARSLSVELPPTYRGRGGAERKRRALDALERVGMAHRVKHYIGVSMTSCMKG